MSSGTNSCRRLSRPTNDMKNGHQKNKSAKLIDFLKQLTNGMSSPETATNLISAERTSSSGWVSFSFADFIASLSIQREFGAGQLVGGFLIACLLLVILYRDIMRYKPAYVNKYQHGSSSRPFDYRHASDRKTVRLSSYYSFERPGIQSPGELFIRDSHSGRSHVRFSHL